MSGYVTASPRTAEGLTRAREEISACFGSLLGLLRQKCVRGMIDLDELHPVREIRLEETRILGHGGDVLQTLDD